VATNPAETARTRAEAAFWLALSREGGDEVISTLTEGMKRGPVTTKFACAAALGRLRETMGAGSTTPDPLDLSMETWRGLNPFEFLFAAREIPNVPLAWMNGAVSPLLEWASKPLVSGKVGMPDAVLIARQSLSFLLCGKSEDESVQKAKWLSGNIPGGLTTVWADRAGVPTDPEGDADVLSKLVEVLETEKKDPGRVRAASFLLRFWSGEERGFDPLLHGREHPLEIAQRWKAWIEAEGDRLQWDAEAGRFGTR
jgi:hypothetical protein